MRLSEGGRGGLGGEELSVRAVRGVDEGVDALAVGAGGDTRGVWDGLGLGAGLLPDLLSRLGKLLRLGLLGLGSELGRVSVVLEVAVRGISRVDEGVEVGSGLLLHWSGPELLLLLDWGGPELLLLWHKSGLLLSGGGGLLLASCLGDAGVKGGALESGGALRDVSALEDPEANHMRVFIALANQRSESFVPEAILSGAVSHGDCLAVLVNVAVLSDPLT